MTDACRVDPWEAAYAEWRAVLWDGMYNARCPCGADTTWNAYGHEPLCGQCSIPTEMGT